MVGVAGGGVCGANAAVVGGNRISNVSNGGCATGCWWFYCCCWKCCCYSLFKYYVNDLQISISDDVT